MKTVSWMKSAMRIRLFVGNYGPDPYHPKA